MPTIIALQGKGSSGKSTLMALGMQRFSSMLPNKRILVVDADPQSVGPNGRGFGLAFLANVAVPTTLGMIRSQFEADMRAKKKRETESQIEYLERHMAEHAIVPYADHVDFLAMGAWEEEGSMCTVNRVLDRALPSLYQRYDIILIDQEGGMESAGRHAFPIHLMVGITSPSPAMRLGMQAAFDRAVCAKRQIGRFAIVLTQPELAHRFDDIDTWRSSYEARNIPIITGLPTTPTIEIDWSIHCRGELADHAERIWSDLFAVGVPPVRRNLARDPAMVHD